VPFCLSKGKFVFVLKELMINGSPLAQPCGRPVNSPQICAAGAACVFAVWSGLVVGCQSGSRCKRRGQPLPVGPRAPDRPEATHASLGQQISTTQPNL